MQRSWIGRWSLKAHAATREGIRVCVVDDEDRVRDSLVEWIAGMPGFCVVGVYRSGDEAVRRVAGTGVEIAVVDLRLGGMSGLDLAAKFDVFTPNVRVIFMTGFPETEAIDAAIHRGRASFLLKPFTREQLAQALKVTTDDGIYLSPGVTEFLRGHATDDQAEKNASLAGLLTKRELEVLTVIARGQGCKQAAEAMKISENTVKNILASARAKLRVQSTMEAIYRVGLR